jgi:hypothetical protein
VTAILDAIDDALTAYADHLGSPWPGRIPDTDELLEALFGPEDDARVPTPLDLDRAADYWAKSVRRMLDSCDCRTPGRGTTDHEPVVDPKWLRPWRGGDDLVFARCYFSTHAPVAIFAPAWLAEEDAWLADRATREVATR